jgi:GT2 family glycosyltransferase
MSTVAICIPTFNQALYLERSVCSALAQTHPCEVWVSDDCSTDETPTVMHRLLKEHPKIQYFRHKQNLGLPGNPRWLTQQPVTDYIVRLDSDDELCCDFVEKLSQVLSAHSSAGYGHAAVQEIDGNGSKRRLRFLARNSEFQSGEESLRASVTGYRVAANICIFRRTALAQVDYYKKEAQYCDDWDLAVRLADAGWGNVYVNKILASYRVWDTPVRCRRKLAELEGCRHVIEQSLIPAFQRRQWSLAQIMKARRRMALEYAICLRHVEFSEEDRKHLKTALRSLGDSPALRWKFSWICTPFASLFQLPFILEAKARLWVKAFLFKRAL